MEHIAKENDDLRVQLFQAQEALNHMKDLTQMHTTVVCAHTTVRLALSSPSQRNHCLKH